MVHDAEHEQNHKRDTRSMLQNLSQLRPVQHIESKPKHQHENLADNDCAYLESSRTLEKHDDARNPAFIQRRIERVVSHVR